MERSPPAPSPALLRTPRRPPRRMQELAQHPQDTPTTVRWVRRCRELHVGIARWRLEGPWRRPCRPNHGSAQSCHREAVQEGLCRMRRGARQTTTRTTGASYSGTPWRRRWWECWRTFERVLAVCSLAEDVAHGDTVDITSNSSVYAYLEA